MRCGNCRNERGYEVPPLFLEAAVFACVLECNRCGRDTLHNLVGRDKGELVYSEGGTLRLV